MRIRSPAVERSFVERLRIAVLTLWLPIMALAIVPVVFVGAASSEAVKWTVVTIGGVLLGGGLMYPLASSARYRETLGASVSMIGVGVFFLTAEQALPLLSIILKSLFVLLSEGQHVMFAITR